MLTSKWSLKLIVFSKSKKSSAEHTSMLQPCFEAEEYSDIFILKSEDLFKCNSNSVQFYFLVINDRFELLAGQQATITKPKNNKSFLLAVRQVMSRCPRRREAFTFHCLFISDPACHLAFRLNVMCHFRLSLTQM